MHNSIITVPIISVTVHCTDIDYTLLETRRVQLELSKKTAHFPLHGWLDTHTIQYRIQNICYGLIHPSLSEENPTIPSVGADMLLKHDGETHPRIGRLNSNVITLYARTEN